MKSFDFGEQEKESEEIIDPINYILLKFGLLLLKIPNVVIKDYKKIEIKIRIFKTSISVVLI